MVNKEFKLDAILLIIKVLLKLKKNGNNLLRLLWDSIQKANLPLLKCCHKDFSNNNEIERNINENIREKILKVCIRLIAY